MFNPFYDEIYNDELGYYVIEVEEKFDNRTIQWRKYTNSKRVKDKGGCYCSYCVETEQSKFYRNDYIRGRALNKFIEDNKKIRSIWDEEEEVTNNETNKN